MEKTKQYQIYKANKNNNGSASSWNISIKDGKYYPNVGIFLEVANQSGQVDKNGNATFNWDDKIIVSLGMPDISEILMVFTGQKDAVGSKGSIFHESPSGASKIINMAYNEQYNNFSLYVTEKSKDGNTKKVGHFITREEAVILTVLLKRAVVRFHNW